MIVGQAQDISTRGFFFLFLFLFFFMIKNWESDLNPNTRKCQLSYKALEGSKMR